MKKLRVWDLPLRLFHWALALLVITAIVSANIGGNAMAWHFRAGYAVLTLLLFRLTWGMVGSRYARFSSLACTPSAIVDYLRSGRWSRPGHNPVGSLAVVALLTVLLAQAFSGLFANDDIAWDGPLAKFISKELSDQLTWFHAEVSATLIYILVVLHLAAILFYWLRRKQNLVLPMITGDREADTSSVPANDTSRMRFRALLLFAACAAAVWYLVTLPAPFV